MTDAPLTFAYLGNFSPPASTENHIARALENNGHKVIRLQENDHGSWARAATPTKLGADIVLWTRTRWDNVFEASVAANKWQMLARAKNAGIPTVGYHLDIWFGLARAHQVAEDPFFQCDVVITADGGHQAEFANAGVNHHWLPPGVSRAECEVGQVRDKFRSPVAFVGSWDGGYHPEHQHRHELIRWLKANFRSSCEFWPKKGEHAIRGKDLQDLYASVDVVVGDSCFAGSGLRDYWSDRVPETLGRGGYLIHPYVPGIEAHFDMNVELTVWDVGDWGSLGALIEDGLTNRDHNLEVRRAGHKRVLKDHTYETRMEQMVAILAAEGLQ